MLAWSIHWWENALHWGWFHGCWPSEYKIFLYWCTGKCIFMQNANAQIWPSVSLMLCLPYCVPLNVSSAVLFVCFISLFAETFVICGGPWRQILFFSYCFPSMCLAFSQAVQQSGLFPIRKNRKLLQETCAHMPLHTIELTSQSHGSNSASEWGGARGIEVTLNVLNLVVDGRQTAGLSLSQTAADLLGFARHRNHLLGLQRTFSRIIIITLTIHWT